MLKPHIPFNSMAHDIFSTPNPVAFYHPCFQRRKFISMVHRVVTGLRIFKHCVCECVYVQGGEKIMSCRKEKPKAKKKEKKNTQNTSRFPVTFVFSMWPLSSDHSRTHEVTGQGTQILDFAYTDRGYWKPDMEVVKAHIVIGSQWMMFSLNDNKGRLNQLTEKLESWLNVTYKNY